MHIGHILKPTCTVYLYFALIFLQIIYFFAWHSLLIIIVAVKINIIQMNAKDTNKSTCRSRESLRRRRRQRVERKREGEVSATDRGQGEGAQQIAVDLVTAKNVELNRRLDEEIKKRKILQRENLDFCRKLEKRQKTDYKMSGNAGTYVGQVHRIIESSKIQVSKDPSNKIIRRIDPSNLTLPEKTPAVLGEGSFGCVKKMLYHGSVEVAVKFLKGDANERHLIHEATVMHEIGDHPGVPFLYGICIKDRSLMLVMQCCSQDGRVVTLSDAADLLELPNFSWSQIILKLTEALLFIHTKGFVHNDLKGNNVLLYKKEQIWQPLIIDYGKCVKVSEAKAKKSNSAQGSTSLSRKKWYHTAPEVFSGQHPPSHASDIFSLGVIFKKVNAKLHRTVVPEDIITACCLVNPSLRIKDALLLNNLNQYLKC